MKIYNLIFLIFLSLNSSVYATLIKYKLVATRTKINISGKKDVDFALMFNSSIPAPVLEFSEGDEAEITVKNSIPGEELSVHWHGILLPSAMDGVPYVTTPPIMSGEEYVFRFKLRQSGTYWYHSHTNVQEQKGLYGAFIINPKEKKIKYDKDLVIVLSDWSDENATDILKNLRKDGDYYLYKKGTMRSWLGALSVGSLKNFLYNEWTRMGGMDLSDVGYDAFLINGKKNSSTIDQFSVGEVVRLRIINAAASSFFHLALGHEKMKVISSDGIDIRPIKAREILIGMAETYDVLFKIPDSKSYELRANAQDGTGFASFWIKAGEEKVFAPKKEVPDLYATMSHNSMHHGMHSGGHNSSTIKTLTSDNLRAKTNTSFSAQIPRREIVLELDGDMNRYIWHFNNKSIHEERTIFISENEVIRMKFVNKTMMHHPMHLHGHFFRVINKNGDFSPLKHTIDVPPHETRIIEFLTNEPGEWMLHCHNLFHLKTGMGRILKYKNYNPGEKMLQYQKHDPHLHDHWYKYGTVEIASNHASGYFQLSQTWSQYEARVETRSTSRRINVELDRPWELEADLLYRRWFNRYLSFAGGGVLYDGQISASVGIGYLLPFLIHTDLFINNFGRFRIGIEKKFQWTKTIFSDFNLIWRPRQSQDLGTDIEFEASIMYSSEWSWSAGLMFTNRNIGVGFEFQF